MIRVFTHYVSYRNALLVGAELLVLMFAAHTGIAFQSSFVDQSAFPAFLSTEVTVFAFAALFIMSGLGIYQLDIYNSPNSIQLRMLVALLLGVVFALLMPILKPDGHGLGHYDLFVAIIVAALGSSVVRMGFYRVGKLSRFKRRVLVLGVGSRVARFAEAAHKNRLHEVVGYIGTQSPDQPIPFLKTIPMGSGESLRSIAKKHRVDEIVVAIRDRRAGGLPLKDLLECKLSGVKVTELPSFFEREYRTIPEMRNLSVPAR